MIRLFTILLTRDSPCVYYQTHANIISGVARAILTTHGYHNQQASIKPLLIWNRMWLILYVVFLPLIILLFPFYLYTFIYIQFLFILDIQNIHINYCQILQCFPQMLPKITISMFSVEGQNSTEEIWVL